MRKTALVIIDIQNDITKHYKDIIEKINEAVAWAEGGGVPVVYIRHENLSAGTRTFKPGTRGAELAPDLRVVSERIFTKTKGNALSSAEFAAFVAEAGIDDFILAGADAAACVKSTCFNMRKAGYGVRVLSDCVTSYDVTKIAEMLDYYERQGARLLRVEELGEP